MFKPEQAGYETYDSLPDGIGGRGACKGLVFCRFRNWRHQTARLHVGARHVHGLYLDMARLFQPRDGASGDEMTGVS